MWPKYWSFNFNISPSNGFSGLISFRMDWLDLLAVQGTLKNLFQYHSSKASILWCSAFFIVQLSHAYVTTGKTIALTRCTYVGKVMSLFFNMLSQFSSVAQSCLFATPWTAARQASQSITNSRSPPKPLSIKSVTPSSHLMLCRPLLLLPLIHMRWPKYCSFSFSISPSNEHPGLISFRMDLLDLLAVQGILKSLLQHHSSKASILRCSAFFTIQLNIHTWLLEKT